MLSREVVGSGDEARDSTETFITRISEKHEKLQNLEYLSLSSTNNLVSN